MSTAPAARPQREFWGDVVRSHTGKLESLPLFLPRIDPRGRGSAMARMAFAGSGPFASATGRGVTAVEVGL